MINKDQLSRRALLGASSVGVAGIVGAAALMSARAQAATSPSFIYKSIIDFGALTTNSARQPS